VAAHTRADIARHDLTTAEFAVLEALFHKGPMLLNEIQRRILVSSGGITYLVDRLAARGLVERRACREDRRASYAALTSEGEQFIAAVFPDHEAAICRALGGLAPAEQAQAIRLLRTLGRHAAALPLPRR
jgi:MarR family transcriptional regulator, 2-MHQ and catechol-resistance regulon repressor